MSENTENVVFRSQLGGYNREDVNKYIVETNLRFERVEAVNKKTLASMQNTIDELKRELEERNLQSAESCEKYDSMKNSLAEAEEKCAALESQLEEAKKAIDEAKESSSPTPDEYSDAIAGFAERVESLENENSRLTAERDALASELASAKERIESDNMRKINDADRVIDAFKCADGSESDTEKALLYDKVSHQLGSMLIDAREIADGLISDANAKAEKIVRNAENDAAVIRSEAKERLRRSIEYIERATKRLSSDCTAEYLKYVNGVRESFTKLLEDNTESQREVLARFDSMIASAQREISYSIHQISTNGDEQ
jgi:chromosome segregation ATPase